jgi:hypothetical protein
LLGAIGAAMDCYDMHFVTLKKEFSLTNQCRNTITTKEISRNDYRNHKSTITNLEIGVLRNEGRATTAQIYG